MTLAWVILKTVFLNSIIFPYAQGIISKLVVAK